MFSVGPQCLDLREEFGNGALGRWRVILRAGEDPLVCLSIQVICN